MRLLKYTSARTVILINILEKPFRTASFLIRYCTYEAVTRQGRKCSTPHLSTLTGSGGNPKTEIMS